MQVVYFNKKKIKVIVLGAVILLAAIILFSHFASSGKTPVSYTHLTLPTIA